MQSPSTVRSLKLLLTFLVLLSGCSHKSSQPSASLAQSPLLQAPVRFEFAVYALSASAKNANVVLRTELLQKYPGSALVDKIAENSLNPVFSARAETSVAKTYPPPTAEELKYEGKGLTGGQNRGRENS